MLLLPQCKIAYILWKEIEDPLTYLTAQKAGPPPVSAVLCTYVCIYVYIYLFTESLDNAHNSTPLEKRKQVGCHSFFLSSINKDEDDKC